MSVILAPPLLIASLFIRDLSIAIVLLIAGNLAAAYPLFMLKVAVQKEPAVQIFIAFLLLSDFFLILSIICIGTLNFPLVVFAILSLVLRISIAASARTFRSIRAQLGFSNSAVLSFSFTLHFFFVAKAFRDSLILLVISTVLGSCLILLLPENTKLFDFLHRFVLRVSRLSHRVLGPILIEWLVMRVPSALTAVARLVFRFLSYASLQRNYATGLLLFLVLLILLLRP